MPNKASTSTGTTKKKKTTTTSSGYKEKVVNATTQTVRKSKQGVQNYGGDTGISATEAQRAAKQAAKAQHRAAVAAMREKRQERREARHERRDARQERQDLREARRNKQQALRARRAEDVDQSRTTRKERESMSGFSPYAVQDYRVAGTQGKGNKVQVQSNSGKVVPLSKYEGKNVTERIRKQSARNGTTGGGGGKNTGTGGGGGGDRPGPGAGGGGGGGGDSVDAVRPGGGFKEGGLGGFAPASFDNDPNTKVFTGGGGAGGATNPLASGQTNESVEQILGAKKGKRQRSRRGTE